VRRGVDRRHLGGVGTADVAEDVAEELLQSLSLSGGRVVGGVEQQAEVGGVGVGSRVSVQFGENAIKCCGVVEETAQGLGVPVDQGSVGGVGGAGRLAL